MMQLIVRCHQVSPKAPVDMRYVSSLTDNGYEYQIEQAGPNLGSLPRLAL